MTDERTLEDRVASLEAALTTSEQWNVCVCGHHGSSHSLTNTCLVCACPHFGTRSSAHPNQLVRRSDVITPELLEAIRALMRIADHSQLSHTNLDLLVYAVRDTIWPETYPEEPAP